VIAAFLPLVQEAALSRNYYLHLGGVAASSSSSSESAIMTGFLSNTVSDVSSSRRPLPLKQYRSSCCALPGRIPGPEPACQGFGSLPAQLHQYKSSRASAAGAGFSSSAFSNQAVIDMGDVAFGGEDDQGSTPAGFYIFEDLQLGVNVIFQGIKSSG
jgi:hypothetical protein